VKFYFFNVDENQRAKSFTAIFDVHMKMKKINKFILVKELLPKVQPDLKVYA